MTLLARSLLELGRDNRLRDHLYKLRPQLVAAAQEVYDQWGDDEHGICDEVAAAMAGALSQAGIDTMDGGQDGDDHAYLYAYDDNDAFEVDIPPGVYERGSGYRWAKIPGVVLDVQNVIIHPVCRGDVVPEV